MKKAITLTIFAALVTLVVYSYHEGPAFWGGIDGTGATGGGGCNNGPCHSASSTNATVVTLDSAGVAVTSYHPGVQYNVKVSASNSSANNWPKFGFQMAAVKLTGAGTSSAVDAGNWGTLPGNVQKTVLTESIIEHNTQIAATTGTGGSGTTYVQTIPWTAPTSGTGSVVLYGVINEVNNDGGSSGDGYQVASHITITEAVPAAVASVSISLTSGNNPTCANNSLAFTATPVNGGTSPTYQWYKNLAVIGGATSATYTTSSLAYNDSVYCIMTSNLSGVTGSPATSNTIRVTVNPLVTPADTITASATTVCANQSVTFTSHIGNGGSNPTYQWKNGNTNINGATSSTYVSSTPANGDVITLVMTSTATCASPTTATSNAITLTVNPLVTPADTITASATTVCANQSVTFTSHIGNGGSNPTYQWKNGNTNINGATSSTYVSATPANGDVITLVITSNANCASPTTATSNAITLTVNPMLTPADTITATATTVCANQGVTFTSHIGNGGSNPGYQWKKGGLAIGGATSSTYVSATPANGDVITLVMTSNATCVTAPGTATSNVITLTVNPLVTPADTITASATTVCTNQSVTFTSHIGNGGSNPGYQWEKGGTPISGATSSTYVSSTPVNGDVISLVLTSNANCASPTTATSNSIALTVTGPVTPSVSIAAGGGDSICTNQSTTITATPVNGGTNPTYQWYKNGTIINGATA